MTLTKTERWLVDYFAEHGNGAAAGGWDRVETLLDANYFELEILDSLGLVVMIGDIEATYELALEPADLQDPRFCSVRGLAQIVDEARAR
jgi:acyl carrier protein